MKTYGSLVALLVLSNVGFAGLTGISYTVEYIAENQWGYNYAVSNLELMEGIEQFTIWFDYSQYESLQIASDTVLDTAWDQLVWQPNETLLNNGGFDALALIAPIALGESVSGFSVSFVWKGIDKPGSQYYEIVNPNNLSEVFDSGFTVLIPEPVSFVLLIGGSAYALFKNREKLQNGKRYYSDKVHL